MQKKVRQDYKNEHAAMTKLIADNSILPAQSVTIQSDCQKFKSSPKTVE